MSVDSAGSDRVPVGAAHCRWTQHTADGRYCTRNARARAGGAGIPAGIPAGPHATPGDAMIPAGIPGASPGSPASHEVAYSLFPTLGFSATRRWYSVHL